MRFRRESHPTGLRHNFLRQLVKKPPRATPTRGRVVIDRMMARRRSRRGRWSFKVFNRRRIPDQTPQKTA